jgi:hypothetical protein
MDEHDARPEMDQTHGDDALFSEMGGLTAVPKKG